MRNKLSSLISILTFLFCLNVMGQTISKPTRYDVVLSHLNSSDRLFCKKILDIKSDPNNKVNTVCGKAGVGKCKWCGKNYVKYKRIISKISWFKEALFLLDMVSSNNANEDIKFTKDLQTVIKQIKSGDYYYCEDEGYDFCSRKCESEFR
mgnify:FL=1